MRGVLPFCIIIPVIMIVVVVVVITTFALRQYSVDAFPMLIEYPSIKQQ